MDYRTRLLLTLSILPDLAGAIRQELDGLWTEQRQHFEELVVGFLSAGPSASSAFDLEQRLANVVRELGRRVVERVYNRLEGDEAAVLPSHVRHDGEDYRRLKDKTPNRHVGTLFGTITLWRHAYRCSRRDAGEPALFPLEMTLGLVQGTTPALAEAASRYLAEGGATQRTTLDRLKSHHGIGWGAQRLRDLAAEVAQSMAEVRHDCQVERVLDLLRQADASRGAVKPVLSVGRDGTTLCDYQHRFFEHATAGTVSVYDRAGKRLATVYLAYTPESGQPTMTQHLTALIEEVLRRWDGPLPRLAYVTDAGENETQYYRRVLRPMRHPRTGAKLHWQRVVDFYHAAQRLWTMAAALFGSDERAAAAWARRMCKLLKKPNGPFRVLHAAAQLRRKRTLPKWRQKEYRQAYNYIRQRTRFMQYHEYAKKKIPLGSGVTEAACKTIYTQRLKLSGMRWKKRGAQVILDLRVMLLSGIWLEAYRQILDRGPYREFRTPDHSAEESMQNAA
jgi:hypothetical protein